MKNSFAVVMIIAGATLAVGDYIVITGTNAPGSAASLVANIDDLNGALAGVAPYVGVGTALVAGGLLLLVM